MGLAKYKKIIFHCGIHKTGTSYLQSNLNENTNKLAARSIHFPTYRDTATNKVREGNHSALAVQYRGEADLDAYFSRSIFVNSDLDTLLLSGEEFSREQVLIQLLPHLTKARGTAELVFVFYLRRFDHLLESVYAQSVKHRLIGDIGNASYQLDFSKFLGPVVEAVGRENVIVRPYNQDHWPNGSLGNDFCNAIGYEGLWDSFEVDPLSRKNVGYSRHHTFLLSRLSSLRAKQALIDFFEATPLKLPPEGSKFFMTPERRRQLNLNHYRSNQPFFDRFGFGDLREMLDLESFPEQDEWTEFRPYWRHIHNYLSAFIDDYTEKSG